MASSRLRLFIGNIPWSVTRRELKEYFSNFGAVKNARIVYDYQTGLSRGYGFIQFLTPEGHSSAMLQDTHILDNYKLVLAAGQTRNQGRQPRNRLEDNDEIE
ncbi:SRA stem-loop-interacting RNA-binding protein, mitochondrial-like [Gigantopelta aegis]|uniref:SRA stem-loop-interacting RNA-binding protein, mitochondrial-like n=1 Tax=Gigantopelta aegis TaxID=1735272 RepID=UPI001B88863E|nr:SRA stem-loop-interacting RNA-binding protein, mitochondrial-like [Gigantopelta aegis]